MVMPPIVAAPIPIIMHGRSHEVDLVPFFASLLDDDRGIDLPVQGPALRREEPGGQTKSCGSRNCEARRPVARDASWIYSLKKRGIPLWCVVEREAIIAFERSFFSHDLVFSMPPVHLQV